MHEATAALAKKEVGAWRATQGVEEFQRRLIYTGMVELDLNVRMAFGSRIQIIGAEHVGKSLLSYILCGAAQRTCRLCLTPIIPWHNDLGDGCTVTTCGCGANDPCTVLYIDAEGDFDPLWAQAWGFRISNASSMSNLLGDYEEVEDGLRISPDSKVALARITSIDQLEVVIGHLIKNGAADVVVLDSIALSATDEDLAGRHQPGSKARVLSRFYTKLISAQVHAWITDNFMPVFIQTNQWRDNIQSGPMQRGPAQVAAGGKALRYAMMQNLELRTRYNPWDGGFREPVAIAEMNFAMKKDKAAGGSTNAVAQARLFLKEHTFDRIPYTAGETDEGPRLLELLQAMATGAWGLPPDDRWFKKTSRGYDILGRTFARIGDIKTFLSRPDIGYRLRYPLFAASLPQTFRGHIEASAYLYSPFQDDPIHDMINEAHARIRQLPPSTTDPQPAADTEAEEADPLAGI